MYAAQRFAQNLMVIAHSGSVIGNSSIRINCPSKNAHCHGFVEMPFRERSSPHKPTVNTKLDPSSTKIEAGVLEED